MQCLTPQVGAASNPVPGEAVRQAVRQAVSMAASPLAIALLRVCIGRYLVQVCALTDAVSGVCMGH